MISTSQLIIIIIIIIIKLKTIFPLFLIISKKNPTQSVTHQYIIQLQYLTLLNQLVGEEDDNPQRKMIMIWSSRFSVTVVITPKCCCDRGIDLPRYSSSNHLCASCELQKLNSLKDAKQAD